MGFPSSTSKPDGVPLNYKKDREPDASWFRPSYHRPNPVTNAGDYDPRTGKRRERWFWDDDGERVEMRGNSNDPDRYWSKESRKLFGNPYYLNEMTDEEIAVRKKSNPFLVDLLSVDKEDSDIFSESEKRRDRQKENRNDSIHGVVDPADNVWKVPNPRSPTGYFDSKGRPVKPPSNR